MMMIIIIAAQSNCTLQLRAPVHCSSEHLHTVAQSTCTLQLRAPAHCSSEHLHIAAQSSCTLQLRAAGHCSSEQLYTESHSIYHSNNSSTKYWLDKQDFLQSCVKYGDPWNNLVALRGSKTCRLQTIRLRYPELAVLFVQSCYGLHGLEIESQWRQDFPSSPDWPQGPPRLQQNGYWVFSLGKEVGVWWWSPPPSSARLQMGRSSISTSPLHPHRHVILANSSKDTNQHLTLNKCNWQTFSLSYLLQKTQAVYCKSVCSLPCSSISQRDMFVLWALQTDTGNICGSRWYVGKRSFLHRCGPSLHCQTRPSSWGAARGCQMLQTV